MNITLTYTFNSEAELLAHLGVPAAAPAERLTKEETQALFTVRHPEAPEAPEAPTAPAEEKKPRGRKKKETVEPAPTTAALTFADDVKPLLRQAWQKMGAAPFTEWTAENAVPAGIVGEDNNWFALDGAEQDLLQKAVDLLKGAVE